MLPIIRYLQAVIDHAPDHMKPDGVPDINACMQYAISNRLPEAGVMEYLLAEQSGSLCVLHYSNSVTKEDWNRFDRALRDCRGLVLDLKNSNLPGPLTDANIVLRPYSKFFNMDQLPETAEAEILKRLSAAKYVEFAEKMDGSLVCAGFYHGGIVLATSGRLDIATSPQLRHAARVMGANPQYEKMIKKYPSYTFMFESIAIDDLHIVDYVKKGVAPGLYLHGARNVADGDIVRYSKIEEIAEYYGIPHVEVLRGATLTSVLEHNKKSSAREEEGFVANIDGYLLKLKGDDYLQCAVKLQSLTMNAVIRYIAEGTYDSMTDDFADKPAGIYAKQMADDVRSFMSEMQGAIDDILARYGHIGKTEFFNVVDREIPKPLLRCVKLAYAGKPYDLLKKGPEGNYHYTTELEINRMRDAISEYYASVRQAGQDEKR